MHYTYESKVTYISLRKLIMPMVRRQFQKQKKIQRNRSLLHGGAHSIQILGRVLIKRKVRLPLLNLAIRQHPRLLPIDLA
jgi:hypothetical protein